MTDRTVVYRIQADVTQARAQMAALGASVRSSADDMTSATREGSAFRSGLDSLGGAAGKVGLVAAAGLGVAVKKAADFDQAMSSVQAATHESAAAMDDLRAAAIKAGADTSFSATEAAQGIEELAKAGVSTADVLGGGLDGALALAAAGAIGVGDAAELSATALTQFKLAGEDIPHVADLLAAGAGKAQGSVADLGAALNQSGLVAAQTGLTIEETTGTLAAFASAGLVGSDAGTSFKTMLMSLTPNSKKASEAMAAMGFSAYDAQGNFKGMTTVAADLQAGLSTMSKEQQNATLKTIFGADAVRAAGIIYEQGAEGIGGWIDKTNDAGYAAETAAIMLDNLSGDLEALGGSLETALIGTGDGAQGPLRSLVQNLTSTANAYNDLGQGAKTGVAVTLAATAALGGGLFVFSKMVQSIAATRLAMTQLGITSAATSKMMKGLGATAGIVVGLVAVTAAAEKLRSAFDESLPGVNELTGDLIALSDGSITSLGGEFDSLSESMDRLTEKRWDVAASDSFGALMGVEADSLNDATREIEALDAALANLASTGGSDAAAAAFEDLASAQGLTAEETKTLLGLLPAYKEALAANENQAAVTASSTAGLASETAALGDQMTVAERQADNFKDTLDGLNGVLDQRGNVRGYQAAIDDFTASLEENGKTFDITTEKGRNNQAALDGIASSALAVAEGLGRADRKKFLTSAIEDIRTMGNSMGLPKAEIQRLIELLQKANKTNVKPKIDVDSVAAMSAIERIRNAMLGIKDKSVTIRVTQTGAAVTPGFGPVREANGGLLDFYANGGMAESHTAQIAPAGAWRVWAEPETGGEAYIPLSPAKRERSIDIWEQVGSRLGVQFERFAVGGISDEDDSDGKKKRRRRNYFDVTDNTKALQASIDRLTEKSVDQTAAVEAQRYALEQATESTEMWADRMADVAKGTVSGFNTGLFERDSNVWAAGSGGGPLSNLTGDIAGLEERAGLQAQLAGMGLSGDALAALLSEGDNADIQALIASGQVSQYADLFNQRAALQGSVGAAAGQQAFGQEYAAARAYEAKQFAELQRQTATQQRTEAKIGSLEAQMNRVAGQVERLNNEGPEATGTAVGRVINGAAASGHREGRWRNG